MAHLVFYRRGQELMRVALDEAPLVVGRGAEADVLVPDPTVARSQARIEWDGRGHRIRDLSDRGLQVSGQKVSEAGLEDGVDIALGEFRAAYVTGLPDDANVTRPDLRTEAGERSPSALPREIVVSIVAPREAAISQPLSESLDLGQSAQAEVRLDHPTVSAKHCRLHRHGDQLLLTDLGSTNGTWLNGLRVYEVEVPVGARFRVGPFELQVAAGHGAPAAAAAADFEGMVSTDPAMQALFAQIDRVASSTAPVAIFGETGTGKELVARAVHRRSRRAGSAFVPLNCSAIARDLMESELFGHEKGSFTGAVAGREGALGAADGGTLFLDEIGELSVELQPKLLRAVELGELKRVGASKPAIVDVRFVCATHRDLPEQVRKERFREDLYYRIAVATLFVPPLRHRKGDIELLWNHFLVRLAPPGAKLTLSDAAHAKLKAHAWPGNVRELRNVLQRALLTSEGSRIEERDIHFDDRAGTAVKASAGDLIDPRGLTLEQIEKQVIAIVLRQENGHKRRVAERLDIAKSTLLKKLSTYGLESGGGDSADSE